MKIFLFLLMPVFGCAQVKVPESFRTSLSGDVVAGISSGYTEIICTRTHIDTIKNVLWYIEIRKEWDSIMPMSTGCPNGTCEFVHTWNDETKEDHWYDVYHRDKENEWAYYIHEVNLIALKPKGKPIIYPKH